MDTVTYDLETEVKLEETTRVDHQDEVISEDIFSEILSAEAVTSTTSTPTVDNTDYTTDKDHILIETKPLMRILSQIAPVMVIGQRSQRAVSRGITLRVMDTNNFEVITPNETYYFNARITGSTTFEPGHHIFLEYTFLQKMAKFLPPKILIFTDKNQQGLDIYYIRLLTGDLELVNTQLIPSDVQRLDYDYTVGEVIQELEPSTLLSTLNTMSKVVNFESDTTKKIMTVYDGKAVFKSPLVQVGADTDLLNIVLRVNDINYFIKAIQMLGPDEKLKICNTNSTSLIRHAVCTENSYMITNYAEAHQDSRLKEWLENQPEYTEIDYGALKYKLDYANSITYSRGVIEFIVEGNQLKGGILLSNGNYSDMNIDAVQNLTIPEGCKFKLNTKTFLSCMNALDTSSIVSVGYKDGLFYIKNSYVTLILLTI